MRFFGLNKFLFIDYIYTFIFGLLFLTNLFVEYPLFFSDFSFQSYITSPTNIFKILNISMKLQQLPKCLRFMVLINFIAVDIENKFF
jgi:hypothetical protein